MSKYYLLTFCEDYSDEHNVPALACMTEEEYQKWLETASGKLNPDWEELNREYTAKYEAYKNRIKEWTERGLYSKNPKDYTQEEREWTKDNPIGYVSYSDKPQRVESNIRVSLGNGGDYFEEDYSHLYLMKEYVEANKVKVVEVDESFYNIFHKAKLDNLGLCNVFEIDEY